MVERWLQFATKAVGDLVLFPERDSQVLVCGRVVVIKLPDATFIGNATLILKQATQTLIIFGCLSGRNYIEPPTPTRPPRKYFTIFYLLVFTVSFIY